MFSWLNKVLLGCVVFLVLGIFLSLIWSALDFESSILVHIKTYFLTNAALNSLKILLGVLFLSLLIGLPTAWLCSFYDFFGRKFFSYALILPFSIPSYILAFIFLKLGDESGVLSMTISHFFGYDFFSLRSFFGLIFVLSLSFFPYIFLMSQIGFSYQTKHLKEACLSLGQSPIQTFFKMHLPLKISFILPGFIFVGFETLSDFGVVYMFNIETLTTAIYKAWFSFFSLPTACLLGLQLIFIIFIVSYFFKPGWTLLKNEYGMERKFEKPNRKKLSLGKSIFAFSFLFLIFFLSFLLPVSQLIFWSLTENVFYNQFFNDVIYSFLFSFFGSLFVIAVSLSLSYTNYLQSFKWNNFLFWFSSLCYGIPGAILAVGFLNLFFLVNLWPSQLVFISVIILFLGYMIRFLRVGIQIISNSLFQINKDWEEASLFYYNSAFTWWKLHRPLILKSVVGAFLFIFIEIFKRASFNSFCTPFWSRHFIYSCFPICLRKPMVSCISTSIMYCYSFAYSLYLV